MIDERHLREMLKRRAETISAAPTDEPAAIQRARRRLARNATVAGLVGLAVVVGAVAGLRTIQATPTPNEPATSPPPPAPVGSLAYGLEGDIYVAELDGSNPVRIADGRPPNECVPSWPGEYWGEGPIWSPDGRYLAYRHTDCDGPEDARRNVVISDPEGNVVAEIPGVFGWDISWSPDSTRLAVWVSFGETIGVFGVDGVRKALLSMPRGHVMAGDFDPVWLPDGESLLVPYDVVVPVDGSTPYTLPFGDGDLGWVVYSPDGSRVAYPDGRSLVVAEADGSNPQVMFDDWAGDPVWSPTGDRIAFPSGSRSSEPDQLRLLDIATGKVTLLAEIEGSAFFSVVDFSPDGDRVFFSRIEDHQRGPSSLWSVNTDGSDLRRLVEGTAWGDWLSPGPTASA